MQASKGDRGDNRSGEEGGGTSSKFMVLYLMHVASSKFFV